MGYDEKIIEIINAELEAIDLADRHDLENFLAEHPEIKQICKDDFKYKHLLKDQYFVNKLLIV